MQRSLNEIVATLRKAGRGAGLDDGSAQEIARAAALALASGEDGVGHALALLARPDRAHAAIAAADLALAGEPVDAPADPLMPYLLDRSERDPSELDMTPVARHGPFDIERQVWDAALALAYRTYVPATDASRLAGAGAGLRDED